MMIHVSQNVSTTSRTSTKTVCPIRRPSLASSAHGIQLTSEAATTAQRAEETSRCRSSPNGFPTGGNTQWRPIGPTEVQHKSRRQRLWWTWACDQWAIRSRITHRGHRFSGRRHGGLKIARRVEGQFPQLAENLQVRPPAGLGQIGRGTFHLGQVQRVGNPEQLRPAGSVSPIVPSAAASISRSVS